MEIFIAAILCRHFVKSKGGLIDPRGNVPLLIRVAVKVNVVDSSFLWCLNS